MKDLESLDAAFVIDTFLLLLIGIGPKIALVPFLDMTTDMSRTIRRLVLRKMLATAATVAVLLLVLGGLLTRLLHFSPGALGVASGILLLIIAVGMVLGAGDGNGGGHPVRGRASSPFLESCTPQSGWALDVPEAGTNREACRGGFQTRPYIIAAPGLAAQRVVDWRHGSGRIQTPIRPSRRRCAWMGRDRLASERGLPRTRAKALGNHSQAYARRPRPD